MRLEELKSLIKEIIIEGKFSKDQGELPLNIKDFEPNRPDGTRKRIWDKDRKPKPVGPNKKVYGDKIADPDRHYKKK